MQDKSHLLSIAIPLYNGEEFLNRTLSAITSQICNKEVEVVLCDDMSKDSTLEIAKKYADKFDFIHLYENEKNLGMDGNFENVANLATGKFIWFSGQDDTFLDGAITKVLEIIKSNNEVNFIHMNFSQHTHNFKNVITEKMLDLEEDKLFLSPNEYINFVGLGRLPSFLPAFIMKKDYWDKVQNKQRFYKSNFVQLGVFLEVLNELKIYVVAKPYIMGLVPDNKWQSDSLKLLDVLSGDLEIIHYAANNIKSIDLNTYKNHYKSRRKWIFNTLIMVKKDKKELSDFMLKRFSNTLTKKDFFITIIINTISDYFYQYDIFRKLIRLIR